MKPKVLFILSLLLLATQAFSQFSERAKLQQTHFSFNDAIKQDNLFSSTNSKMLDTGSVSFKTAKSNVLDYCNKYLKFRLDSVAIYYSCREYSQINPNTNEAQRKWMEDVHLKHEFFITFKVHSNIDYHLHFYLDSLMQVQSASEQLFKVKPERIFNILDWSKISQEVFEKQKKFILPLEDISLEYDSKYARFVYVLTQQKTDKTKVHQTSDNTGNYKVNQLVVDAETGAVLEKTEQKYSYIADLSW